jgi:hypothetical protein
MAKLFDKDGNDITPVMPDTDNLVHLGEIGGEFEECAVSISFQSENLDKHKITELLGVAPTKAWNPKEKYPVGNGKSGKFMMQDWGLWVLESEIKDNDPEKQITALFERCSQNLDRWTTLSSEYDATLSIAVYTHNWNRELRLANNIMRMLVERGFDLWVDAYFEEDEEEIEQ